MEETELPLSRQAAPLPPDTVSAEDLLSALNPEQRAAVEAVDGAVLVLAGAGTGKTRVLTTRLAYILRKRRAWPSQTLTVTFTNKAAREMRVRASGLIGSTAEELRWLGTFHSVSARILRQHAESAGLKSSSFSILDTDDQLRLCKQVIEAEGLDSKRWSAKFLGSLIDGWKNRALWPDKLPLEESERFANGRGGELYRIYQHRLETLNACDFGDLPLRVIRMLQTRADILADFHKRFRYILVDEYQDTNVAQYLWLRLLARGSGNICCVGDDDQSIYGWRGAEVGNILRFEQDFEDARIIRLERNYRSTGHILGAASCLISKNRSRLGKTLRSEAGDGERVRVCGLWDDEAEARHIAEIIEERHRQGGEYSGCAVLVRASWQMRSFEECFIRQAIPYRVIGGARFYERAEIRDGLAYLRLLHSFSDDLAFERIVNQPRRGIGETSMQKLRQVARESGRSLLESVDLAIISGKIGGMARSGLRRFADDVKRWGVLARSTDVKSHVRLAECVLDESGYTGMLQADKSEVSQARLENLKELVQMLEEFDSLGEFLEHVQLVMDTVSRTEDTDQVQIMTLHSGKGLEWPCVFLPGWEEEVFPSRRSLEESGVRGLEEERRLAHVGLTRAQREVVVSFVANRRIHGRWQSVLPSRFIDELPTADVEAQSVTGYGDPPVVQRASPGKQESGSASGKFVLGQHVRHRIFGKGRVVRVDGHRLQVDFGASGVKRLVADFVEAV